MLPRNECIVETLIYKHLDDALGGNRTPILRTGILRAIRCTTSADMRLTYYMSICETLQV
jgi:hypothetical protein